MFKIKIGVDVGGTFTDTVAIDEAGEVFFAKLPSTPEDQSIGVVNGLMRVLKDLHQTPDCVTAVAHGTTVATNTLLERNGAVTALITTEGFRDVLYIGRQSRDQLYDLHALRTEPLVPRYLRREAGERTLYTGEVLVQLDEDGLRETVRDLVSQGAQSVAVCFLHSYVNSENERRALQVIRETAPDLPVSVSSEILPEFREFERMNTTVMNAYVQPRMQKYISHLLKQIRSIGVDAPMTIMQSSGGMMTDAVAASRSVNTLLSGPAGGVLAAEFLAKITDYKNLITGDLGGTSFDVSVITNGKAGITNGGNVGGFDIKFPHIDITTIGAGGGSVAWLDAGGALRVGPRSAGAVPGPVCYSKGGTEPTVTDAHVVLGRVGSELLSGEMRLDVEGARTAIREKLAGPLNMTVEEVAEGILKVANANMVRAIRVMTVEKGIDPRKYAILPYGGAGSMHATELARVLEVPRVIVPVAPGNFSAFGLLVAPLRYDQACSYHVHEREADPETMEDRFLALEAQAREAMRQDNVSEEEVTFERSVDLRYFGQAYELSIRIPDAKVDETVWNGMVAHFHETHESIYGFRNEGSPLELVNLRLAVIGKAAHENLYTEGLPAESELVPIGMRPVYFMGKWIEAKIYSRDDCRAGHTFFGPAVVEEKGATTVIGPGDAVSVDKRMNLVIQVASAEEARRFVIHAKAVK